MKKICALLLLLMPVPVEAQFTGYVGLQTIYTPVVLNTASTGRFQVNANIGASYHTFTYCLSNATAAVQLVIEQSPDGQAAHFTQVAPVSEFPWQAVNGNNCGVIRVGGYYSILAANVLFLTGGAISIWYTATAGPTDIYPPAVNSSGGTSPVDCDQSLVIEAISPGSTTQLVPGNPNQGIYICGGIISYDSTPLSGSVALAVGSTSCGGVGPMMLPAKRIRHKPGESFTQVKKSLTRGFPAKGQGRPPALNPGAIVWFVYTSDANTDNLVPINSGTGTIRIPPTPAGSDLCLVTSANIGADTAITLNFAQF